MLPLPITVIFMPASNQCDARLIPVAIGRFGAATRGTGPLPHSKLDIIDAGHFPREDTAAEHAALVTGWSRSPASR